MILNLAALKSMGLVAWWPLGTTPSGALDLNDYSGNGHTLTAYNSPTIVGLKNGSASPNFNGSNQYLAASASSDFNPNSGSMTFSFWYNPTSHISSAAQLLLSSDGLERNSIGFRYFNTYLSFLAGDGSSGYKNVIMSSNPSLSSYHFIVGTIDRTNQYLTLYVDLQSIGTVSISGATILDVSSKPLYLAYYPYSTPAYSSGKINNVMIFKGTALSMGQIRALYDTTYIE